MPGVCKLLRLLFAHTVIDNFWQTVVIARMALSAAQVEAVTTNVSLFVLCGEAKARVNSTLVCSLLCLHQDFQAEVILADLPPSFKANNRVCDVAPESDCNPEFGASVGRGAFNFQPGAWSTISMRVLLNDENNDNGEIELFSNGKSVISVDGLRIRDGGAGLFRGLMMQTFFGGTPFPVSGS